MIAGWFFVKITVNAKQKTQKFLSLCVYLQVPLWVLIDLANFGLCLSMDFAISTRTPLQAILTSLQTSYRPLSRRGSQTVSI